MFFHVSSSILIPKHGMLQVDFRTFGIRLWPTVITGPSASFLAPPSSKAEPIPGTVSSLAGNELTGGEVGLQDILMGLYLG